MARRLFVLIVSISILAGMAAPSRAQPGQLAVTLLAQPVWHGPDDDLGLKIRLSNPGPTSVTGYVVTVAVHGRVLSRSELHQSFEGASTLQARSLITGADAPNDEIAPGEAVVLEIDEPVSSLQSLTLASESGVYPLEIGVFDPAGAELAAVSTQLLYYPSSPEFRLPFVPVVPISDVPSRAPDGTFAATGDAFPLEEGLRPGGWLSGLLANLDRATTPPPTDAAPRIRSRGRRRDRDDDKPRPAKKAGPLHVGLVVMPRLAEELGDMADGYRRGEDDVEAGPRTSGATQADEALETIERIADRASAQPLLAPYSLPDLPTLFDGFLDQPSALASQHLARHLDESESVLQEAFGDAPTRDWIYTAGGRLSHIALEELQQRDAARFTFFAEESLEPIVDPAGGGCPEPTLTFACATSVTTSEGRSTGYVFDPDLQQRVSEVAAPAGGRSALQRLFAETAMIREEVPSRTDRVVVVALPTEWEPPPRLTRTLFSGLQKAPWLQTMTPEEGLSALTKQIEPVERRLRSSVPHLDDAPDNDYFEEITRAHEEIDAFRGVQPPPDLVQRLTRNTLVSESRLWWTDATLLLQGKRYAEEAADEAARELGKISVGGSDEIALTSSQAQIPVVVFNDAGYEATVTVRISSADLRLNETFSIPVQARGLRQLSVDVATQSSGIFTVYVTVETPNGRLIDRNPVQVRSTEFNEIALGLTFGALAFLVLFYITRAVRTRKAQQEGRTT